MGFDVVSTSGDRGVLARVDGAEGSGRAAGKRHRYEYVG